LHLVGYLYYWQMGFNSVFKGLTNVFTMGLGSRKLIFVHNLEKYHPLKVKFSSILI